MYDSAVLPQQALDLGIAHPVNTPDQIADAIAVHRISQPELCLHFVTLSDGHITHVIAEARDPRALGIVPGGRRPHPDAQLSQHVRILPVAHHHLPG